MWLKRAVAMLPVVVHAGSTTAGYATVPHRTWTLHLAAPGAVTARPHGIRGSPSTAHPLTSTAPAWLIYPVPSNATEAVSAATSDEASDAALAGAAAD